MKVIKDDNLSVTHRFLVYRHDNMFMLNALAAFSFDAPDAPLADEVVWDALAEACGDNIFDESIHKNIAEFIVHGACFQPGKEPSSAGSVRVKVGEVEKKLLVFGDRYWTDRGNPSHCSEPAAFTRMEVSWANAFGGKDHAYNRFGKGIDEVEFEGGRKLLPLPNIEAPDQRIYSPQDRPEPAGLDMLGTMRFWRGEHMGTYDDRWLAEHWPYHASDVNFEGVNQTLRDQWMKDYFQGGEPVEIANMHPDEALLRTRLPRLRVRFFIRRILRGSAQFGELPADFDTVWLLPERKLMVCAWRTISLSPVHAARDISHLLAVCEPLDQEPLPGEYYYPRLGLQEEAPEVEKPEKPEPPESETPQPPDPEPSEAAPPPPHGAAGEDDEPPLDLFSPEMEQALAAVEAECKKRGVAYPPSGFTSSDPFGLEGLSTDEAITKLESLFAENKKNLETLCAKAGLDPAQYVLKADSTSKEMLATLEGLKPQDLKVQGAVGELKKMLQEMITEEEAEAASPEPEIEPPPEPEAPAPEPPPPADSPLTRELVEQWAAEGKSLAGKDLTGLDLSDLILAGVVFARAVLENAVLRGTDLTGADLSQAILSGADFSSVKADHAVFTDAAAAKIQAGGASLAGADFAGADLAEADLTSANLQGANLSNAILDSAVLRGASLAACQAVLANFTAADLAGAALGESVLSGSWFDGAKLDNADFAQADLRGAAFSDASGVRPCFAGADLTGSKASGGTNFEEADFSRAGLEQANWIDCDLKGASFELARLDGAQFRLSRFEDATFRKAKARRAVFDQADLTRADLQGLDAFKASLREASLLFTDMRNANFYSVDFFMAKFHETQLADSILGATILSKWRPLHG